MNNQSKSKSKWIALSVISIFAAGQSIHAAEQKTSDSSKTAKMTCEDFIALDEVSRPKVIYWVDGFNRKGQINDETIDFVRDERLVPVLVEECRKNPKQSLVSKVKTESKKNKTM